MNSAKSIFSKRNRILIVVVAFFFFISWWVYTIQWGFKVQLTPLIESMRKHGLPVQAWQHLSGKVVFQVQRQSGMASAEYRQEIYGHSIFLPSVAYHNKNGVWSIKTLEDFVQMEIDGHEGGVVFGKIMHEFWHAYLVMRVKEKQPDSWKKILSWATPQFYDGTNREIEAEFLEEVVDEAFGVKVERIYSEYIRLVAYQRKGWKLGRGENTRWQAAISDLFQGYYTKKHYGGLQKELVSAKIFYHRGCAEWLIFDILEGKFAPPLKKILEQYKIR